MEPPHADIIYALLSDLDSAQDTHNMYTLGIRLGILTCASFLWGGVCGFFPSVCYLYEHILQQKKHDFPSHFLLCCALFIYA